MTVSVVVLGYGPEPYLRDCLAAILSDSSEDIEVVVVDNGIGAAALTAVPADPRLRVVGAGTNLGFAGGCNLGADHAGGDVLVFVNSDVIVAAGAVCRLAAALEDASVGIACADVHLADRPALRNSAGNPVHYVGLVWSGGFGESVAEEPRCRADVAAASGAFFAMHRDRWRGLGGFAPEYFAYHEDADLSLRSWLRGWRVVVEPAAVGMHHYEFARNPRKRYLLDRNRWVTVVSDFPAAVLFAALPMILAFEVAVLGVAAWQGWLWQKVRAWCWLVAHARWLLRRRQAVQRSRSLPVREFAGLLAVRLEPAMIESPRPLPAVNRILVAYWNVVCRLAGWPSGPGTGACHVDG